MRFSLVAGLFALRGNLDPTEQLLLEPGHDSLMMFPNVQADEHKVVFQKTISLADQGKVVIAP